jgi:hypothetical protein
MKQNNFKPEFIRPVPKYILTKIRRLDMHLCPEQKGPSRMYSYLTKIQKELVKITVAVKNRKKKRYCKQVAAHGVNSELCWVRDMEYLYFSFGYRVGWHAEGLTKYKAWYEDGNWHSANGKYYNAYSTTVNPEYAGRFPEYRYSAYEYFKGNCIIEYLRLYKRYPQTEYLLKLGLFKLHNSVTVLRRIDKDKAFCKWLISHKDEITSGYCYIASVMRAYKTGRTIKQVQAFAECKKRLQRDGHLNPLKELFGNDRARIRVLNGSFLIWRLRIQIRTPTWIISTPATISAWI